MKNYLFILSIILSTSFLACKSDTKKDDKKEENKEPESEWVNLFNGEKWLLSFIITKLEYANTFRVKDSIIQVNYGDYDEFDERYGHLFYEEPFSSYHLKFEYRFTKEWMEDAPDYAYRNSGVMFHSQAPETILKEQDWPISVEYQMLADEGDGEPRPTGNMCSPGTEVFFEGEMDPRHWILKLIPLRNGYKLN